MNRKEAFLKYQAQITKTPFLLDVEKAQGSYIYTRDKKRYIDTPPRKELITFNSIILFNGFCPKISKKFSPRLSINSSAS